MLYGPQIHGHFVKGEMTKHLHFRVLDVQAEEIYVCDIECQQESLYGQTLGSTELRDERVLNGQRVVRVLGNIST